MDESLSFIQNVSEHEKVMFFTSKVGAYRIRFSFT